MPPEDQPAAAYAPALAASLLGGIALSSTLLTPFCASARRARALSDSCAALSRASRASFRSRASLSSACKLPHGVWAWCGAGGAPQVPWQWPRDVANDYRGPTVSGAAHAQPSAEE